MEDQSKQPSIAGLNSAGGLILAADFNQVAETILELHAKASLGVTATLCEMGCAEHIDDVTYDNVRAALGLMIFCRGIEEGLSVTEEEIGTNVSLEGTPVTKHIAFAIRNNLKFFKTQIDKQPGFSKNAKDRLINGLKSFLGETFAKNLPGYTHGVDFIIKDVH
jgi:hypothetical protein